MAEIEVVQEEPSEMPAASPNYKTVIFWGYTDALADLEARISAFLNSGAPKAIVSISMSSLDIRHFVLIVYKEGG